MRVVLIAFCFSLAVPGCKVFDADLVAQPSAQVPPPPAASTSSPDDSEERVFVLRNFLLNQPAHISEKVGLDLDGVKTTDVPTSECRPRVENELTVERISDGENGIDNSLGKSLAELLALGLPCLEDDIAHINALGIATFIYRLQKWNGQPDDADVDVSYTTSVAGTSAPADQVQFDSTGLALENISDGMPAPPPAWDGEDVFFGDPDDYFSGDINRPRKLVKGYVSSGRLVVRLLPNDPVRLIPGDVDLVDNVVDGSVSFSALDAVTVADLNEDGSLITFGIFSGRATVTDLARSAERLGTCGPFAATVNAGLDGVADALQVPGANPDAQCDSVTFGVPFDGISAVLAGIAPAALNKDQTACPDGMTPRIQNCCPTAVARGLAPGTCDPSAYTTLPNPIPVTAPEIFEDEEPADQE